LKTRSLVAAKAELERKIVVIKNVKKAIGL
jgi:hypothetical protein